MVSPGKKSAILLGCGSFAVVLGAVMVVFWPVIFFGQLQRMMILTEESTSYGFWKETPLPIYLECYFWNITNSEELYAQTDTIPEFKQMGPYIFVESHLKSNITWNDNSTVTFYNKRTWMFNEEMSNGSLSDLVTNINPIVATVAYYVRDYSPLAALSVNAFFRVFHEHMFLTANVSSWLFDGIEDPVLTIATHLPDLKINIPFDKFGFFYDRNNSLEYDGIFVMNTGAEDFSRLGNTEMWKYSNETPFWGECARVQGSIGELWAPEADQEEVFLFAPDLCTFIPLQRNNSVSVLGLNGMQFIGNHSLFDNGYNYPQMACYCDENAGPGSRDCLPPGALNISRCRYGAPAFVSLPHFTDADPKYLQKIKGMEPSSEYLFRFSMEMYTGIPLGVNAQLQINFLIRHIPGLSILNSVPDDVLIPAFWFRQRVDINEEMARMARFALNVRDGVRYGLYALTGIGILLLIIGVIILVRKLLKSPETAPILDSRRGSLQND